MRSVFVDLKAHVGTVGLVSRRISSDRPLISFVVLIWSSKAKRFSFSVHRYDSTHLFVGPSILRKWDQSWWISVKEWQHLYDWKRSAICIWLMSRTRHFKSGDKWQERTPANAINPIPLAPRVERCWKPMLWSLNYRPVIIRARQRCFTHKPC